MKTLKFSLFTLFCFFLFPSCNNDESKETQSSESILLDKYAVYGKLHNQILDETLNKLTQENIQVNNQAMLINCLNNLKTNAAVDFIHFYTNNAVICNLFEEESITKSSNLGRDVILDYQTQEGIGVNIKNAISKDIDTFECSKEFINFKNKLFTEIMHYTTDTIDTNLFNSAIRELSIRIEKARLDKDEEEILMVALNVAKGSYTYWQSTFKEWQDLKQSVTKKMAKVPCYKSGNGYDNDPNGNNQKDPGPCIDTDDGKGGYDYGKVVGADVGGAIVGGILGSMAGGIGSVPGAIGTGSGASISEGISQLWDNWTK